MAVTDTIEINGEEREIADAYAREQCAANAQKLTEHDSKIYSYKVFTKSGMSYDAESDEIVSSSMYADEVDIAQRVNWHDDALRGVSDTMKAVKKKTDTDIEGLNSNLDLLNYKHSEWSFIHDGNNDTEKHVLTNTTKSPIKIKVIGSTKAFSASNAILIVKIDNTEVYSFYDNSFEKEFNLEVDKTLSINCQRYADAQITVYSNNIGQSIDSANESLTDLKMLGWSVPKECPVQNYVDSDGVFHQRVGRLDLGSLDFELSDSVSWGHPYFQYPLPLNDAKIPNSNSDSFNGYCYKYKTTAWNGMGTGDDKSVCIITSGHLRIKDTTYTDATSFKNAMKGVYLYYELSEEKTISVDGNEAVTKLKNDLSGLSFSVSGTTLSITDGTNTWSLTAN